MLDRGTRLDESLARSRTWTPERQSGADMQGVGRASKSTSSCELCGVRNCGHKHAGIVLTNPRDERGSEVGLTGASRCELSDRLADIARVCVAMAVRLECKN